MDPLEMENHIVRFYSALFTSEHDSFDYDGFLDNILVMPLSDDNIVELSKPFVQEKVYLALKDMFPTKSPDPDGFCAFFFKRY